MKLLKILSIIIISPILMSGTSYKLRKITLYPINSVQAELYPVSEDIFAKSDADLSERILERLTLLNKQNGARFPEAVTVSIKNNCALVNLIRPERSFLSENDELLTVYSIVNSLTSSGDIVTVEFLINGKSKKNLSGFLDMRESFIPDYFAVRK